jgi:hypothetical protein
MEQKYYKKLKLKQIKVNSSSSGYCNAPDLGDSCHAHHSITNCHNFNLIQWAAPHPRRRPLLVCVVRQTRLENSLIVQCLPINTKFDEMSSSSLMVSRDAEGPSVLIWLASRPWPNALVALRDRRIYADEMSA